MQPAHVGVPSGSTVGAQERWVAIRILRTDYEGGGDWSHCDACVKQFGVRSLYVYVGKIGSAC